MENRPKRPTLTWQERRWLAKAADPDKIERTLKAQYCIGILLLSILAAYLIAACLGCVEYSGIWVVLIALQLLSQYLSIRANRHLLKEGRAQEGDKESAVSGKRE